MGNPYWISSLQNSQIIHLFPGSSGVKDLLANAEDTSLIPGSGRSPGEGNDNTLQYFCLGNPMEEEPGGLHTLHGVAELDTT